MRKTRRPDRSNAGNQIDFARLFFLGATYACIAGGGFLAAFISFFCFLVSPLIRIFFLDRPDTPAGSEERAIFLDRTGQESRDSVAPEDSLDLL